MIESPGESASDETSQYPQSKPPSDTALRALLGPAWNRYQTALKGLTGMALTPEFYRYTPSGGWAVRFQVDHATGCALYLAESLTGLVAVGARTEAALCAKPAHNEQMILRLVLATPRRGSVRWVKMPLRAQEDVRRFLSLVGTKLQPPRAPQTSLNHTPRPRTTAAAGGRKRSDTPPHRSTAHRSSRG